MTVEGKGAQKGRARIRPYRAGDRTAVREICRRTAFRNQGSRAAFEDGELFADYWSSYYTDHEPGSAWVAHQDGRVIAYVTGCRDTPRFIRTMARSIMPRIALPMLWRLASGRYKRQESKRFIRWALLNAWRESPKVDYRRYPAHFHCNVLREGLGQGLFTEMVGIFLDHARGAGVNGMHAIVLEPENGGTFSRLAARFSKVNPNAVRQYSQKPTRFARLVFGDETPMVNRAYCGRMKDCQWFFRWIGENYRI